MNARLILTMMLAFFFCACASSADRKAKEGFTGPGVDVDPQSGVQPEYFRWKKTF